MKLLRQVYEIKGQNYKRAAIILLEPDDLSAIGCAEESADIEQALAKIITKDRQALVRAVMEGEPIEIVTKALSETQALLEKRRMVASLIEPCRKITLETT